MDYPLAELLHIRELREQAAASNVRKARLAMEQAQQELQQARKDLEEYVAWRLQREAEMYEEITGAMLSVRELENFKEAIARLRDKERDHRLHIRKYEENVQQAVEFLEQCRSEHIETVKNRRKLDEHEAIWRKEAALRAQALEERELEEVAAKEGAYNADGYESE